MSAWGAPRHMLWLAAGFATWGSALVLLYGLHALGCAFAWPAGAIRVALWAVLILHLLVLALLAFRLKRARGGRGTASNEGALLGTVAAWTLFAAFAATLLGLAPPLTLSVCL